jgi:hypothetical protein
MEFFGRWLGRWIYGCLAMLILQFDNSHVEPFDFFEGDQVYFTQQVDDLGLGWVHDWVSLSLVPGGTSISTPTKRRLEGTLAVLFRWSNGHHQPHISRSDPVTVCHFRHSFQKRVFAFRDLKANPPQLRSYQIRGDFVDLDLIRSGLSPVVGKAVISDDQSPTRFERPEDLFQHLFGLRKMVVGVHHQDGGKRFCGEFGIVNFTLDDFHIPQIEHLHSLMQEIHSVVGYVFCEHPPGWTNKIGHALSVVAVSGSHVGNPISGGDCQCLQNIGCLLIRFSYLILRFERDRSGLLLESRRQVDRCR